MRRLARFAFCLGLAGVAPYRVAAAQDGGDLVVDSGVPTGAAEASPLQEALAPILEDRLFQTADIGIQLVDVSSGDEVWSYHPTDALVPASVNKVLTTAVALRQLGPAFVFTTDLLAGGEVDSDGLLAGDLFVRGGGDPTLVVEQLWKMAVDLQSAGVTEIDGDIVFDDSAQEAPGLLPGWGKSVDIANGPAYFAPLGALTVNYNATCLLIAPGGEVGQPAQVDIETKADVIRIDNRAVTGSARSRRWLEIERAVDEDGGVTFTVSGNLPLDSDTRRIYRAVGDPTVHFMAVFRALLAERGITVTGRARRGGTPDDAELLVRHASDPLGIVLSRMNKRSSNIMAEQVLRAVGAAATGGPGTTAAGLDVVRAYLDDLGIPREEYRLVNGSGLSRDVRLRPDHVTAVLLDLWHDPRIGPEFLASLAVGGVDGTLRRRLDDGAAGLLRGKTGSLNSVYCLAGFIHAGDNRVYAFSFLVNGFRGSSRKVRALQDRFAQVLLDQTSGSD